MIEDGNKGCDQQLEIDSAHHSCITVENNLHFHFNKNWSAHCCSHIITLVYVYMFKSTRLWSVEEWHLSWLLIDYWKYPASRNKSNWRIAKLPIRGKCRRTGFYAFQTCRWEADAGGEASRRVDEACDHQCLGLYSPRLGPGSPPRRCPERTWRQ